MRHTAPLLLLALTASACERVTERAPAATGGTLIISTAADVDALVPPLIAQLSGRQVADQMFDRLAEIGDDLNTIGDAGFRPALAESWSWSEDSLAIAFRLRSDARWHDGQPVTARDVRFSYALFTDPAVASPGAEALANIDSVSVADALTAVVWFARRTPQQFFDVTYFLLPLPAHLLDTAPPARLRETDFARRPVGNGRFRFGRWTPGTSLELVADTANYRGRPGFDRVIWTVATDFTTAATRFFAGQADVFEFLRPEQLEEIARRDELEVITYPSLVYGFVQFNLRDPVSGARPHPLFADRQLRRALSMAVDREAMVRNVFDTLGLVALGPMTRALAFADTTIAQLPFDAAAAEQLLDSLGWRRPAPGGVRTRGGRQLRFTLLVPGSSRNRVRMAVLLQEQLRRAGVRMEIEQLEYGAFMDRGRRRNFDAMFGAWQINVGPAGIRQTWGTPGSRSPTGLNFGAYENPAFDAQVDSALAADELAAARAHFRAALEMIVADAPAIWLYEPRSALGLHSRLRPDRVRADAWWAGLSDWTIDPAQRLPRDGGLSTGANIP